MSSKTKSMQNSIASSRKPTPIHLAAAIVVALAAWSGNADAAGLGRLSVSSALGQPLQAEVEVTSVNAEEAASLSAKLASPEAFRAAGLQYNNALAGLRMAVQERGGRHYIRLTSSRPINEPFVDLMVELNWASGKFVREYTFLLDPPELRASRQTVEGGSAAGAPVAPAVSARATPQAPGPIARPPAARWPGWGTAPPRRRGWCWTTTPSRPLLRRLQGFEPAPVGQPRHEGDERAGPHQDQGAAHQPRRRILDVEAPQHE